MGNRQRHVLAKKKAHAQERFMERYGITLDDSLAKELVDRIQTRIGAQRIGFVSNRCSLWSVFVEAKHIKGAAKGRMIPVVYDKDRKLIATALPESCNEMDNVNLMELERELNQVLE